MRGRCQRATRYRARVTSRWRWNEGVEGVEGVLPAARRHDRECRVSHSPGTRSRDLSHAQVSRSPEHLLSLFGEAFPLAALYFMRCARGGGGALVLVVRRRLPSPSSFVVRPR